MDETKVRSIIQNEIKNYMGSKQFGVSKIPSHLHNGTDTSRINIKDLIMGTNQSSGITEYSTNPLVAVRENYTFTFSNPRQLIFHGFIANGANGTPTPTGTTKRAITNGSVLFGNAENLTELTPTPVTTIDSDGIIQGCNYMYIDSTDLTKNRVGMSTAYIALAMDDTSTIIGSVSCLSYSSSSITVEFYVNVGYVLTGSFLIT